jgi:hypothetical protein
VRAGFIVLFLMPTLSSFHFLQEATEKTEFIKKHSPLILFTPVKLNWFSLDTRPWSLSPQRLQPKDDREDRGESEGGNQSSN